MQLSVTLHDKIINSLFIMVLAYSVWLYWRNNKVYRFCGLINSMCYDYCTRHVQDPDWTDKQSAYYWFMSKEPPYSRMLYSFKPLTLEAWFDKELIDKLKS